MAPSSISLTENDKAAISRREVTLTRGSQRAYEICVQKLSKDARGKVQRTPQDITGGELRLSVKDLSTGETVIDKTSATATQISIRDPQEGTDVGKADIFFIPSDTEDLDPEGCYEIEIWAILTTGERDTVLDPSPFRVIERNTAINDTPAAPPAVGDPAPQTEQERSFQWTWSATGDTDTVTIPLGGAMRATTYCVAATIVDVPAGGNAAVLTAPSAGRTLTTFTLLGTGVLLVGTTIDIILRDRA